MGGEVDGGGQVGGGRLSDSDLHLISAARQVFQELGNSSHLFTSSFFHNCLSSHLPGSSLTFCNSQSSHKDSKCE